jgi:phosphatidylglycerol:prolipoprotein diacylglycerol transferase
LLIEKMLHMRRPPLEGGFVLFGGCVILLLEYWMYPLLRVGPLTIVSFSALLSIGLLGGVAVVYLMARRRGFSTAYALDAVLFAAVGGLVGARVVYVAGNWAYYSDHLGQAFDLWGGGHIWHGGLVGGLVAVLVYAAARGTSPQSLLDVLTPGAAFFAVCAWLGCFLDKCAYGIETYPGQGLMWMLSLELPDMYGIRAPRVAVQLLGAGWAAVALSMVIFAGRYVQFERSMFPLWLTLYCAGSFGLGFLRADPVPNVAGWRLDQAADLALFAVGAVSLVVGLLRNREVVR